MALHNGKVQGSVETIYCSKHKEYTVNCVIYAFSSHIFKSNKILIFYVTTNPKEFCYRLGVSTVTPYSMHYTLTYVNYS